MYVSLSLSLTPFLMSVRAVAERIGVLYVAYFLILFLVCGAKYTIW
jgi:hypothetical protein